MCSFYINIAVIILLISDINTYYNIENILKSEVFTNDCVHHCKE